MKLQFRIRQKLKEFFFGQDTVKKDIHALLEETLSERRKILPHWEKLFQVNAPDQANDIHSQLRVTISRHKKIMRQWDSYFLKEDKNIINMQIGKAA